MTYVVSNLHGNYQKYKALLSEISFKDTDILYVLGDIVDYGEEPMELIGDMSMRYNVYPIVGEHDYRAIRMLQGFDNMLKTGDTPDSDYIAEMTTWMTEGGKPTLDGFRALDEEMREGVLDYLSDLALYEEVTVKGKTYLLVHAGIADFDPDTDIDDYQPEDFITEPATPGTIYYQDKTLIVGHVPTESGKIERSEGVIAIDGGVAEGGSLACLCLETGKEFYV
jgi:serine/threonine protein phosphatase 1